MARLLFPQLGVLPRACLCPQLALGLRLCNFRDSDQRTSSSCILGAWGKEGGPLGLEAFDGNRIHDVVMSEERYGWPLRKDTSGVKGSG